MRFQLIDLSLERVRKKFAIAIISLLFCLIFLSCVHILCIFLIKLKPMFTTDHKPTDPNYANLKRLSFTFKPAPFASAGHIYGLIVEFGTTALSSDRQFVTCYSTGFCAFYSTQNGGNINGTTLKHTEVQGLSSFEQFISSTPESFPDAAIAKKAINVLTKAADVLIHTQEATKVADSKDVQVWLLTSSGIFSRSIDDLQLKTKGSVWLGFLKEVNSILADLQAYGSEKMTAPVISSTI